MASSTNLREYLLIVQEKQLNVPSHATAADDGENYVAQTATSLSITADDLITSVSPAIPYNAIWIRLDGGNAFTMRAKPITEDIMSGGGYAYIGQTVSGRTGCVGTLQTKVYGSQIPFLFSWICTLKTTTSVPWTNVDPAASGYGGTNVGDLMSCSIYHVIKRPGSTNAYKCRMYGGVKVMGATLSASSDNQVATLSLNLQGCRYTGDPYAGSDATGGATSLAWATDPTQDAYTVVNDPTKVPDPHYFPYDPILFTHSRHQLKIYPTGQSPSPIYRTQISSINLNFGNKVDARFFESRFANYLQFVGRQATLTAKILYKPKAATGMGTDEDRYYLETLAKTTCSFGFDTGSATTNAFKTATFNLNTTNVIRDIADDTPVDRVYEQTIQVQNIYDYTGGTPSDFSFAWTKV